METAKELNVLTTLLPFACIVFIIAIGVILLNQQFRKKLHGKQLEQEALKKQHQAELLRSSIAIQEEERKRVAQNLHDELGAILSIARMHVVQLEQQADVPEKIRPSLQHVRTFTETALASMRRISHELMPHQLQALGLVKTLHMVADQTNQAGDVQITITADEAVDLPWSIQLGLYRVSMELINNSLKHGQAGIIDINIRKEEREVVYLYSDNGTGIAEPLTGTGLGLKGIEGRVNALDGTWQYGNAQPGGFYAEIKIPVTGNDAPTL